nr:N,N-dimethylformamidase beta subunit family domain-containing protein [Halomonas smyrnensis]
MEWAYAYGFSKKYASSGWASYERLFARWAEEAGYELDFVTLHDIDTDPHLLARYQCAIFVGHDEYWSAKMRDSVDNFVENGGRVARFAGNFFWQIRLEDEGRSQICYKHTAVEDDPLIDSEQAHLVSGAWEMSPINRPGALTFGVNGLRGIYAGLGRCISQGSGGFTVYRPDHWIFEGTGLGYGDQLGASARVFGYEVDGLEYSMDNGLPTPTGADGADTEITILGMGLATTFEPDAGIWGETSYIGSADAEFRAMILHGKVTDKTLDACSRGNGVIIHWHKGKGEVFTAATCEWVMGLSRQDNQVIRVTRNVLDHFGSKTT